MLDVKSPEREMVFNPGFPGFDHGIENGEQFAHHRVVPGGGQGSHVKGRAHLCMASPTHYVGPRCAGLGTGPVAVERGEGGNLAAIQLTRVPLGAGNSARSTRVRS